jgi:hypothetical protein
MTTERPASRPRFASKRLGALSAPLNRVRGRELRAPPTIGFVSLTRFSGALHVCQACTPRTDPRARAFRHTAVPWSRLQHCVTAVGAKNKAQQLGARRLLAQHRMLRRLRSESTLESDQSSPAAALFAFQACRYTPHETDGPSTEQCGVKATTSKARSARGCVTSTGSA